MKIRKSITILAAAALLFAGSCIGTVFGNDTAPGTAGDPVVSKSYVDAQIAALEAKLDDTLDAIGGGSSVSAANAKFEIVKVDSGKKVIAGASAEIILRSGSATAIASQSGGVADLTGGTDLKTGTSVPKNHLLLVPADDGRGIKCTSMSYVMVKGDYSIK